jgi:hypothetical protein
VTQVPAALPTKLTQALAGNRDGLPVKVCAQDETRLGWPPLRRRRMSACGVQPVATVSPPLDHFDRCGAVDPTPGDRCFLDLPLLKRAMLQRWLEDLAQTCATSFTLLVLDHGACQTAKILRWPSHVATVPCPP